MHRSQHRWYSPSLNREMELLVFGHAGAPVLVFPTSQGRFYEYEDRNMVRALSHQLEQGWIQLVCVDSVDAESWYAKHKHPRERLAYQEQYERYILHEVKPFIQAHNPNDFWMLHGCSFGAIHAMAMGLRHPTAFRRIIALSGYYDVRRFLQGYQDEMVYYHNPVQFVAGLQEGELLEQLRRLEIILAIGRDDGAADTNAQLSDALWSKNIWHAMRWWDGWSHDWPFWERMIVQYINGID